MPRRAAFLPNLLATLVAIAGCESAADQPLPAQIEAVFQKSHADGEFNGVVLVTRGNAIVYHRSFGLADRENAIPNAADTTFLAFSVNKPLTAVLVFQLIENGKLRLDDPLDRFFSNLASKPAGDITLRQ